VTELVSPQHSVKSKLLLAVMVTTLAALAVAATGIMVYELRTYEASRANELAAFADLLGAATGPALAFNDQREAEDSLSLLRVRPSIIAGALYDASGRLFAAHQPDVLAGIRLPPPGSSLHHVVDDRMILARPIVEKGETVGSLILVARYEARERLVDAGLIVGAVMLLSLLIALPVSTWLGRRLSRPLLDITDVAHRVMERRDFSVRVTKTTNDEIGYLVDTFNAMLDEVGRRAAALEDADRKKDQFLAVLSHELRNPINPIRNAIAVLRMAQDDPAKVAWAGDIIDRQARLLSRLLDDLMDVARITQNKIELRMQVIDIGSVLDLAVESARASIEANRQQLHVDKPVEPVFVLADPARLAQVLGNILSNAAKYTPEGGAIAVRAVRDDGKVRVSIRDTGLGIAPENLGRVFDMFVQVSNPTSRVAGGLGIGLALVRAFVEMHGGTVAARSEGLGKGSEFIVALPTVAAPVPSGADARLAGDDGARGLRVLVADDVADSLTSLSLALQLLGHTVRTAPDGVAAVEAAHAFHPDVAILDIGMPGLSGYDVAARIRATDWGGGSLLIALTGWGQRDDVLRAHRSGFDHHMTKPADFATLRRMIDAYAAAHGAAAPAQD
jgi:signal transduction histidine kinase/ActR/RegA family two-component response regulator